MNTESGTKRPGVEYMGSGSQGTQASGSNENQVQASSTGGEKERNTPATTVGEGNGPQLDPLQHIMTELLSIRQ